MATKGSNPSSYPFFSDFVDQVRERERECECDIKEDEVECGVCFCWIFGSMWNSRPESCPYVGVEVLSCNGEVGIEGS